jgi:hypothetical protein
MPVVKSSVGKRHAAAACASLLVLALAGCGSSGSSGLSKPALVSHVNSICKRHTDVITAGASKLLAGGKLPSGRKFAQFAFGIIVPQTAAEINQASALKPQSSLTSAYKQWLATLRADLAKIRQNPVIVQSSASFVTVNHQAKALGFSSACDVGPST